MTKTKPSNGINTQTPVLRTKYINSLTELGRDSKTGEDEQLVLEALVSLVQKVCESPYYNGDSLRDLLDGLEDMIVFSTTPSDAANFRTAAQLINKILSTKSLSEHSPDLRQAIQTALEICQAAVSQIEPSSEATRIILSNYLPLFMLSIQNFPKAKSLAIEQMMKIGVIGLEKNQEVLTFAVLDAIDSTLPKDTDYSVEFPQSQDILHLIGLVARVRERGISEMTYVDNRWKGMFFTSTHLIENAHKLFIDRAMLQTANAILKLADSWNPKSN
jgi:hypothetical protein